MAGLGPERPHTAALVGLVFVAVALVGLGTGFLVGWAGSGAPAPDAVAEPSASGSARVTPTPSATKKAAPRTRAASEIERGRRSDVGFILGARQEADGMHVTFDRALLYFGADARRQARQLGLRGQLVDGRLLVNQNPLERDVVLAPGVRVLGAQQLAGSTELKRVTLQRFLDTISAKGSQVLLDLTYDRLGYLVEIREKILDG